MIDASGRQWASSAPPRPRRGSPLLALLDSAEVAALGDLETAVTECDLAALRAAAATTEPWPVYVAGFLALFGPPGWPVPIRQRRQLERSTAQIDRLLGRQGAGVGVALDVMEAVAADLHRDCITYRTAPAPAPRRQSGVAMSVTHAEREEWPRSLAFFVPPVKQLARKWRTNHRGSRR